MLMCLKFMRAFVSARRSHINRVACLRLLWDGLSIILVALIVSILLLIIVILILRPPPPPPHLFSYYYYYGSSSSSELLLFFFFDASLDLADLLGHKLSFNQAHGIQLAGLSNRGPQVGEYITWTLLVRRKFEVGEYITWNLLKLDMPAGVSQGLPAVQPDLSETSARSSCRLGAHPAHAAFKALKHPVA